MQPVTKVVAASGGSHFAASLAGGHVAMVMQTAKGSSGTEWLLVGCSRQLPAANAGVAFGEAPSGQTRFFSLGALLDSPMPCLYDHVSLHLTAISA